MHLCVLAYAFLHVGMRVRKHTELRAFISCVCKHFRRACKYLCICVCLHAGKLRIGARASIYARVRVYFLWFCMRMPVTAHEPFFFFAEF